MRAEKLAGAAGKALAAVQFLGLCACATLSACATLANGTTERVVLESRPSGAHAQTSLGIACLATPCAFDISRNAPFTVTFTKPGYRTVHAIVETMIADDRTGIKGNIGYGVAPAALIDVASGAVYYHAPNPVMVVLQPRVARAPVPQVGQPINPLMQRNTGPPPSIEEYLKEK